MTMRYWRSALLVLCTAAALPLLPATAANPQSGTSRDEQDLIRLTNEIDVAVDRKDWPLARRQFTNDVKVDFTSLVGGNPAVIKADQLIAAWQSNLAAPKKTFHLRGNHLVTVTGDKATIYSHGYAWNQLTGLTPDLWEVWGHYTHEATRTADGWKVTSMTFVKTHERGNVAVRTTTPGASPSR